MADWLKCSIPLQEQHIPDWTVCVDLWSNLNGHPPENCCHGERTLKGPRSSPRTQGLRANLGLLFSQRHLFPNKGLSAGYFRSTCIFTQPALCAGDCLWALRFYHQCLFKAEWKIAPDENIGYFQPRMWDASFSYRAEIWFLPLFLSLSLSLKLPPVLQSLLCLSLISAIFLLAVHKIIVHLNKL